MTTEKESISFEAKVGSITIVVGACFIIGGLIGAGFATVDYFFAPNDPLCYTKVQLNGGDTLKINGIETEFAIKCL